MTVMQIQDRGYALSTGLYYVMSELTGDPVVGDLPNFSYACGRKVSGLLYSGEKIPDVIASHVDEMVTTYQGLRGFLGSYQEIEADDPGGWRQDFLYGWEEPIVNGLGQYPLFFARIEEGEETENTQPLLTIHCPNMLR